MESSKVFFGQFFQMGQKNKLFKVFLLRIIFISNVIENKYEFICLCCIFNELWFLEVDFLTSALAW